MPEQALFGIMMLKDPLVECIRIKLASKFFPETALVLALINDLGRLKSHQQLVGIFLIAFGSKEFSCGYVQKGQSVMIRGNVHSAEEIVGMKFQQLVGGRRSGRYHLG